MFMVMTFLLTKASHMTKADVIGAEKCDFTKERGRESLWTMWKQLGFFIFKNQSDSVKSIGQAFCLKSQKGKSHWLKRKENSFIGLYNQTVQSS